MNFRLLALATIVASTTGAVASIEPAHAQNANPSAARFKYADNLWQMEKPRTPGSRYLPTDNHMVRSGNVSPSVLGLDKGFLAKPEPVPQPVARPQVAASPFSMVTTPKVLPSSPKPLKATPYSNQFGKPQEAPPLVAQQPEPMQAAPDKFPQETQSNVSGKLCPPRARAHHSRAVAGRLARPGRPVEVAKAAPVKPIANYSSMNHYSPGSFVNGFSHKSVGSVHGEIINR